MAKSRHFKNAGHGPATKGRPTVPKNIRDAKKKLSNQKYWKNHKDKRVRTSYWKARTAKKH